MESWILIDSGINVIVYWDFNDGSILKYFFFGDFLVCDGDYLDYIYIDYGMYLLNVIVLNVVSILMVIKYLYV